MKVCGLRTVPIETGESYLSDDSGQTLMTIEEFIDEYILPSSSVTYTDMETDTAELDNNTTDDQSSDRKRQKIINTTTTSNKKVGYLAQHRLFDQILELKNDFFVPDYCALLSESDEMYINNTNTNQNHDHGSHCEDVFEHTADTTSTLAVGTTNNDEQISDVNVNIKTSDLQTKLATEAEKEKTSLVADDNDDDDDVIMNMWLGPSCTVSPLHHDPYHNLLAQVHGYKYIRLYDRKHSSSLYPMAERMFNNRCEGVQ